MATARSKCTLINASAFELLQLRDVLMMMQCKGIQGGSNMEVINTFGSIIGMYNGTPTEITQRITTICGTIDSEVGYLSHHNMTERMETGSTQFYSTFRQVLDASVPSVPNYFDKFSLDLEYAPINKFYSLLSGTGKVNQNIHENTRPFDATAIADNSAQFVKDGNSILLIIKNSNGAAINIPIELRASRFHYYNVTRVGSMFGLEHQDAHIEDLKLTINGQSDGLMSCGILDFNSPIAFSGKNNVTILRFEGILKVPVDQLWTGTYMPNHFDKDVYIRAMTKLSECVDDLSVYDNITAVWVHHLDLNAFLIEGARNTLSRFSGVEIFSPACLSVIATDGDFHANKSSQGKFNLATVLSTLYSICIFTTMRLYFR